MVITMNERLLRTDNHIDEIISEYSDIVYRIAYANVQVKADADDVFQEVFLLYCRKAPEFENETHRRNWLINVTLKCCKKATFSSWRKHTAPLDDFPGLKTEMPLNEYELYSAVRSLPEKYRQVIYLYYYEGFSAGEISGILNRNASTVRSHLRRGREKLKSLL